MFEVNEFYARALVDERERAARWHAAVDTCKHTRERIDPALIERYLWWEGLRHRPFSPVPRRDTSLA